MTRILVRPTLAMIAAAAISCSGDAPKQAPAKAVRIEPVAPYAAPGGSRYSANVEPRERVVAAFRVGGYVDSIARRRGADGRQRNLQKGDTVARGEILARLRDVEYRANADQARAAVEEARAGLEKARLDAERATNLYQTKSIAKPEYDAAKAGLEAAQARAAGAEAQLGGIVQTLEDCALKSPLTGVVLDRSLEAGQLVGSGAVAFVLADVSSVKAVFGVPDHVVKDLKPGDSLPVRSEVLGSGEFGGTITAISPAADVQSRVFDVEVTIPNPFGELKPGMIASVEVGAAQPDAHGARILAVPLASIVKSEAGDYAVFVVEGDAGGMVARSRRVELGGILGNRISVLDGLKDGERIVSLGSSLLVDGDAVRIIP
ncbi:MAG TPA: efflux RND transporter periplasmic adaptor subunit [Candidatus Polarisedimenticolia bacterium]|nr:efflux RND transporter periplasmic adaptor subunit [Candidatus Polarisedimenticolia bacterium]